MRSPVVIVLSLSVALSAGLGLLGACSFSPGPGLGARGGSTPGPGGETGGGPGQTGGNSGFLDGGFMTGGDAGEILIKDAGMCIREPGQDDCTEICNVEMHMPERLPPDVLILLDKSQSMNESTDNTTCTGTCMSKWVQVTAAINDVVTKTDRVVNWGLKYFGTNQQCGVRAGADVGIGAGNHDAIIMSIMNATPASYTPTRVAEISATDYLKTLTARPNPKYIVLATDGLPNCAPGVSPVTTGDEAGAQQAVADALTAGIPTFVVGISTKNTPAEATLNAMAVAGGVPRMTTMASDPKYYSVASTADLQAALMAITGQVATCDYPLAPAGPTNDPDKLTVHLGGTTLPRDAVDGWDYTGADHKAIKLFGAACAKVMTDPQAKVEVFYGCPGQPPVP